MEAVPPAGAGVVFPAPEDKDFDEDIGEEERKHYVAKYKDLNNVRTARLHCTACDRHLGCAAKGDGRMRTHPMLRTLVCRPCHTFYNSGEFERGDDGSELYCRWCGQGGQVYCCSGCPHVFCAKCIKRNLGPAKIREIESLDDWKCFKCMPRELWDLRARCWALLRYCDLKNRQAYLTEDSALKEKLQKDCAVDDSECCKNKKRNSITSRKKEEKTEKKEVKVEVDDKKSLPPTVKIPSGIQVKKFATVSVDSILKAGEKKAVKRPGSPMMRPKPMVIRAPIPIAPFPRNIAPMVQLPTSSSPRMPSSTPRMPPSTPRMPQPKRIKMNQGMLNPGMLNQVAPEPPVRKYTRAPRPRYPAIQYPTMSAGPPALNNPSFNGYGNYFNADNINLSLESLTQGLDMASVAAMSQAPIPGPSCMPPTPFPSAGPSGILGPTGTFGPAGTDNELVCTPDFPMEPLCETFDGCSTMAQADEHQPSISVGDCSGAGKPRLPALTTTDCGRVNRKRKRGGLNHDQELKASANVAGSSGAGSTRKRRRLSQAHSSKVTEEAGDDDVECITPGPIAPPKPSLLPHRSQRPLPDLSADNIVQMTENDVTVNAHTGGLKFRVDPQTLSSNKMYRLPDGRIFAINSNPSMPGGYSATIVAVSETGPGGTPTPAPLRGATYAANLSAVVASPPPLAKLTRKSRRSSAGRLTGPSQAKSSSKSPGSSNRNLDMKTPIEWYRYNLIDAVDALEYSLSRLNRMKKEADSRHLRTRTVDEMRSLHRTLERHLHTSASRFTEVRDNLNRGFKAYLKNKGNEVSDDDDVEILPDSPSKAGGDGDDPIFIDENSIESGADSGDNPDGSDRDITALSSEHNDSGDLITSTLTDLTDPLAEVVKECNESNERDMDLKESNEKQANKSQSEEKQSNETEANEEASNKKQFNDTEANEEASNKKQFNETEASEEESKKKQSNENYSDKNDSKENYCNENKSIEKESSEKGSNQEKSDHKELTEKDTDEELLNKYTDKDISLKGEAMSESVVDTDINEKCTNSIESENDQAQDDVPEQDHTETNVLRESSDKMEIKECNESQNEINSEFVDNLEEVKKGEHNENLLGDEVVSQDNESVHNDPIPVGLIPQVDLSEGVSKLQENNKLNGSSGDPMELDIANGQAAELSKNTDNDLQMSDEMIENLLADDGTTDGITADEINADLQKLSHSLDSLADTDLVNSEFN